MCTFKLDYKYGVEFRQIRCAAAAIIAVHPYDNLFENIDKPH